MTGNWDRVARAVRTRRHELGLTQAQTPGISPSTWSKLENARQASYRPIVLARVEKALQWPAGTIASLVGEDAQQPTFELALHERVDALERRVQALERHLGAVEESNHI